MVGSRFAVFVRMLVLIVLAIASLEVAASAQDTSGCFIKKCTNLESCGFIDVRRCVTPNPQIVGGACNFATPFPGCDNPDTDGDGLADFWEDAGAIDINCDGVYDSNDVFLPGANKQVKDVYLKLSAMQSAPDEAPGVHIPSEEAIRTVVAAFAGSHLKTDPERCDANSSCSAAGFACSAQDFVCLPACATDAECGSATDGGRCVEGVCRLRRLHVDPLSIVPHSTVVGFGPVNDACVTGGSSSDPSKAVNFYDIKANNFEPNNAIFKRYGMFGHYNTCDSPETCAVCPVDNSGSAHAFATSGIAENPGNDFIVTLGGFDLTPDVLERSESATLMHELGHNLGLNHSGTGPGDDLPVPNQVSVMNYLYNFGIPTTDTPGSTTLGSRTAIDFSHAGLGNLDESSLNESIGVPGFPTPWDKYMVRYFASTGATLFGSTYTGTPIDWNGNGAIETHTSVDLNNNGVATDFFTSTEEWSRLDYVFQCSWSYADGAQPPANFPATQEISFAMAKSLGLLSPPVVSARLDVNRPCVDPSSHGAIPVILWGSKDVPVPAIDVTTVRLNNAAAISISYEDRDGDGNVDFLGRFRADQMQLAPGSTVVTLTGRLKTGQQFQAFANVKIVTGPHGQCK